MQAHRQDDDGFLAARQRCTDKKSKGRARRDCVRTYKQTKDELTSPAASSAEAYSGTSDAATKPVCTQPNPTIFGKEERNEMARCLRSAPPASSADAAALDALIHRHLLQKPADQHGQASCKPFSTLLPSTTKRLRACVESAGQDVQWTRHGLVDTNASKCSDVMARQWLGTADTRCLLAGRSLLFLGNSVLRRQLFTLLDLLAGPRAHRLLPNGTAEVEPAAPISSTRIWDLDGHEHGYHGAQLFTVDLATGDHRFSLPYELCGVGSTHANFNAGRAKQWTNPTTLDAKSWRNSRWRERDWRPAIALTLSWPPIMVEACGAQRSSSGLSTRWAGSHHKSFEESWAPTKKDDSPAERLRKALLAEVRQYFIGKEGPSANEWLSNVTAHVEEPPPVTTAAGKMRPMRRYQASPSAWLLFPTYFGGRESFNGYCGDPTATGVPCTCTNITSSCERGPCYERKLCKRYEKRSAKFVDYAGKFALKLTEIGLPGGGGGQDESVSETEVKLVHTQLSPIADDCWVGRDRCMGWRPCNERLDSMYICRSTALLCPRARDHAKGWPGVLEEAKAWIPSGHPSTSLLYIYDGQTQETSDATFKAWGEQSVGYGSDAIIFGPQFASTRSIKTVKRSLELMETALSRARACTGHATLAVFRSPAFNFDPVNTFQQQITFEKRMRPIVEQHKNFLFVDYYRATFDAAFPSHAPDPSIAVRFDRNSAFHYLDAGRYLMMQILLHIFRLLTKN